MIRADITSLIIGAAIKVHRKLGPGLLESAYEACLAYELEKLGLQVQRQKAVPLIYGTVKLECGFRADLVVDGRVVVEIKCKEALHPVDQAQLLSHLRLLDIQVRAFDQLPRRPTQGRGQAHGQQLSGTTRRCG